MTVAFDPVRALEKYHAAIEARDLNYISSVLAETAVYQSKGLGSVQGRAAIIAAMVGYFGKYPDNKSWDTSVASDGLRAARCEWQLRATDARTGAAVSRHGTERIVFDGDGLIASVDVEDIT